MAHRSGGCRPAADLAQRDGHRHRSWHLVSGRAASGLAPRAAQSIRSQRRAAAAPAQRAVDRHRRAAGARRQPSAWPGTSDAGAARAGLAGLAAPINPIANLKGTSIMKHLIWSMSVAALVLLASPAAGYASEIRTGPTASVAAGETVDDDFFGSGDAVTIAGRVTGDVYA